MVGELEHHNYKNDSIAFRYKTLFYNYGSPTSVEEVESLLKQSIIEQ